MKPLWKISGKYAGVRNDDLLYDSTGKNVGFFEGEVAYSIHGKYIGEILNENLIGKRLNISYPIKGVRTVCSNISITKYANRVSIANVGWNDPDF